MRHISIEEGRLLVKAARNAVWEHLKDAELPADKSFDDRFSERSGVFVTLNDRSGLRGCVGHAMPVRKLSLALKDAAISAAVKDPRFPPLSPEELDVITFEVTVLTTPEKIVVSSQEQYLQEIKIGRDGVMVRNDTHSGLLLPQVPMEYGWNEKEFLEHSCQKAGLPKDCWMDPDTEILRFEGMVFREECPNGNVIEGKL